MNLQSWQYLIKNYLNNSITKEELNSFLEMIEEEKDSAQLKAILQNHWNEAKENMPSTKIDWNKKLEHLFIEAKESEPYNLRTKKSGKNKHWRWLAAASVVAILVLSKYIFFSAKPNLAVAKTTTAPVKKDVAPPASTNAILTLANGKTIALDSIANGAIANEGAMRVEKLSNGEIVYKGKANGELEYNLLTVPRGSKIATITLSDSTKVWLNSSSSLRYPVAFNGNERDVEIEGEAYFEVSHNAAMPFHVKRGETSVTVLGTHFNVNAYDDETSIKVTLLQGVVKVEKGSLSGLLKPGQQAQIEGKIKINNEVDVDEVMAWKNGEFQFGEAEDIHAVMRQIARWYDVNIEYKEDVAGHIGGTISRNENVSQVLSMLQMTGAVKFVIEDNKIVVTSNHL